MGDHPIGEDRIAALLRITAVRHLLRLLAATGGVTSFGQLAAGDTPQLLALVRVLAEEGYLHTAARWQPRPDSGTPVELTQRGHQLVARLDQSKHGAPHSGEATPLVR